MNTRERRPEERSAGAPQGSNTGGGAGTRELQTQALDLLEASNRVIERALSTDSARFLSQHRQSGGQ
jgi:hypothetical protein